MQKKVVVSKCDITCHFKIRNQMKGFLYFANYFALSVFLQYLENVTPKEIYVWVVALRELLVTPATNWDAATTLMIQPATTDLTVRLIFVLFTETRHCFLRNKTQTC